MTAADRRQRLRQRLAEAGLDALLITNLTNVRYLSGFRGSAGELLVGVDAARDRLAVDGRYTTQAAVQAPDLTTVAGPGGAWVRDCLGGAARVGLEAHAVSWQRARELIAALPGVEVVAAQGHVEALRACKDDGELAAVSRACTVADAAFAALLDGLGPGMTERQVAVALERAMVDRGAADPAFGTIVAAGPNGAVPHHRPSDRPLAAGELVTLDFGAVVDGYCSDMTRTVALGDPGPRLRAVYDVVHAAQAAGVAALRDGVASDAVDSACRDIVAAAGYGDAFVHGTGHGIGLAVHEDPYLRPTRAPAGVTTGASATLRARMTVTVEPGVYLPGVGGVRIEDTLAVTATGAEVLTATPKDLVVL